MDSGDCPSLQDKPELVDIGEPRSSVEIQEQRMNIVMPDAGKDESLCNVYLECW